MTRFSGDKIWQRILLLLSFLIVCAALWAARDAGQQTDLRMRRALVRQTRNVAATISPADVRALSFTAKDKELPEFKRLSSQLKTYAQTVGLRSLYTMALRNGQILFGPENLSPDDPFASPPGTVYQEPSLKDFEIFKTGEATVQGPISDEYGTFVSASVPVINPRTGKVLMVVGLDQEASVWRAEVRKAQWVPFLTGMIPLGILLAGYWVLKIRQRMAHTHYKRLRHAEAVTCATLLLLLTLIAARLIHNAEKKSREDAFYTLAQIKAGGYIDTFKNLRKNLNMLVRFFESSDSISRKEFSFFCDPFIKNNPIQDCFWLPQVPESDAAGFTENVRANDDPDFSIWQLNKENIQEPSQGDPRYPALYIEPLSIHEKALGYDLYSEPLRRTAIQEALTSGEATATDPVSLVAPFDKPSAILIFKPISAKRQKGMAGLAVRPGILLSSHLHNPSGETLGLPVALFQLHEGEEPLWIASSLNTSNQNCWETLRTGLHAVIPVFAFGKTYGLLIAPEPKWLAAHPLYQSRMALGIGLILTVLMTTLVATLANRPALLEKRVQQRTKELAESQEYLEAMWNAMDVGIMLVDAGTREILRMNPTLLQISGQTAENLLGKRCHKLVCPAEKHACPVGDLGQAIDRSERILIHKDGHEVQVEKSVTPITLEGRKVYVETLVDITERKQAEAKLRRLSTAIEQSPETVIITDPDGIIQYVNPAFEAITGYPRDEALGKNPRILKSGQHDNAFYSRLWQTITSGTVWEGRFVNKHRNGSLYTEEASIAPVRNPEGQITGYVAIKRDITEELAREEQLQHSQKMEAVGQLAGGIAHDFNNILQAILGFSELLMPSVENEERSKNNVLEIQKAAKHAADLTRQLLTFSRKQPVQFTGIDLNKTVSNTQKIIESVSGENVKLKRNLAPDLQLIHADNQQIERIIINLALNARDAMPGGGELIFRTEQVHFSNEDIQSATHAQSGDFACLSISDTGTGMSEDTAKHIFEPFFSTKAPGKGTGLGLASVYGIVKQHKGWINVYSELNQGTTFKIYLPVHNNNANQFFSQEPDDFSTQVHGKGEKILIVENNPPILTLSETALKNAGYAVKTATNAREAEQIFNTDEGNFDLLFSDIVLPEKSGTDLAKDLLKNNPGLKIVLCSGYSGDRIAQPSISKGTLFFLEKPFSIINLLKTVHQALTSNK